MGLVSAARTAVTADYGAARSRVADVLADDLSWTDEDQAALTQHLLVNPPSLLDRCVLDWREALEALVDLEARRSRIVAHQQRLLVGLAGGAPRVRQVTVRGEDDEPRTVALTDEAVELVSVVLRRSPDTVRRQLGTARMLAHLPRTIAAVESGTMSAEHAEQIARIAQDLALERLEDYEEAVLARVLVSASVMTSGETAAFARRVRARLDAAGEEARRQASRKHEDVRIWAEFDGLACVQARIPLVDAARVHAALDARARRLPYDPDDSIGMRRAMALVEAICGNQGDGSTAVEVEVHVTCDLSTLLGLADEPALVTMPAGSPEPVTADALRELLSDPRVPMTLRRLVLDPLTGHLLDRGRTSYRVPDSLRAFLVARDGSCRFPGCPRRADRCDIDHIQPWDDAGGTDRDNLIPLCRRHHLLKTHGEWSIAERREDGSIEWLAPDGRRIVTRPWTPHRERAFPFVA